MKKASIPTLITVLVSLAIIVIVLIGVPNLYAETVSCRDHFSRCTEGGCDAEEGWIAQNCMIEYCKNGSATCGYPEA